MRRCLAGEIATRLDRIHAGIERRPAARQPFVEQPRFALGARPGEFSREALHCAVNFFFRQAHHLDMVRLKLQTVTHPQLHAGLFSRRNHRRALFAARGHGFFAHHMFARRHRRNRVFSVKSVRRDDVDNPDVGSVRELGHIGVGQNVFFREAILLRPLAALALRIAGDDAGKINILREWQFRPDALLAKTAQSAQHNAKFAFVGGLREDERIEADNGRSGNRHGFQKGTTGDGGALDGIHDFDCFG